MVLVVLCIFLIVSELQEEGINAINLPLSPSHYELDPEDTMLGKKLNLDLLFQHTLITHFWFITKNMMEPQKDVVLYLKKTPTNSD